MLDSLDGVVRRCTLFLSSIFYRILPFTAAGRWLLQVALTSTMRSKSNPAEADGDKDFFGLTQTITDAISLHDEQKYGDLRTGLIKSHVDHGQTIPKCVSSILR